MSIKKKYLTYSIFFLVLTFFGRIRTILSYPDTTKNVRIRPDPQRWSNIELPDLVLSMRLWKEMLLPSS